MIVVLDTNVIVSAQLSARGNSARIVRSATAGSFTTAFDDRIIDEYRDVLLRPKFGFDPTEVQEFLDLLTASGGHVVANPLDLHLPDPDDAAFIEVAVATAADFLITGNKRHFPLSQSHGIKVVSPSEFVRIWTAK